MVKTLIVVREELQALLHDVKLGQTEAYKDYDLVKMVEKKLENLFALESKGYFNLRWNR